VHGFPNIQCAALCDVVPSYIPVQIVVNDNLCHTTPISARWSLLDQFLLPRRVSQNTLQVA
jgi:hypothetical protein